MKKLTIYLMTIIGLMTTSCTKERPCNYELLTNATMGWQLVEAISEPGYELPNGRVVTDLINDGYLYEYELDDKINFWSNGVQVIDPGVNVGLDGDPRLGYQSTVEARWSLSLDQSTLNMQIPFFYNEEGTSYSEEVENCRIVELTPNKMVLWYTWTDENSTAKGIYTFTLTYKAIR